jgi:cytochrome P450
MQEGSDLPNAIEEVLRLDSSVNRLAAPGRLGHDTSKGVHPAGGNMVLLGSGNPDPDVFPDRSL